MAKNHWLVKQEPEAYSWTTFLKEGRTAWTGVRNFQARNNLRAMHKGDWVLFYHSVSEKQVVGLARVEREAYPDPTADEGDWSSVDLVPVKTLKTPVSSRRDQGGQNSRGHATGTAITPVRHAADGRTVQPPVGSLRNQNLIPRNNQSAPHFGHPRDCLGPVALLHHSTHEPAGKT